MLFIQMQTSKQYYCCIELLELLVVPSEHPRSHLQSWTLSPSQNNLVSPTLSTHTHTHTPSRSTYLLPPAFSSKPFPKTLPSSRERTKLRKQFAEAGANAASRPPWPATRTAFDGARTRQQQQHPTAKPGRERAAGAAGAAAAAAERRTRRGHDAVWRWSSRADDDGSGGRKMPAAVAARA